MNHLVFGVIAVCAGLFGVFVWWDDFGLVLRGLIPLTFVVLGLIGIGAGLVKRTPNSARAAVPPRRREPTPAYAESSMEEVAP